MCCTESLPIILHGSGALAPYCLKNCRNGGLAEWEEWSWQVKSYISLFHPEVTEVMDSAEIAAATVTDEKLTVIEQSEEAITGLVAISRQLHYLLSQITTDSARLIVRGNAGLNGFET